jgi:peroxiredoxin
MKRLLFVLVCLCFSGSVVHSQVVGYEVGNIAPEIELPDAQGENISLSSFRGVPVLIDFWASWCGPCIKEQPELLKLYSGISEKFSIFGVSLDSKKASWTGVVNKLKIPWTQVSDLKYWSSPVVADYKIQALPYNILIDKNGIIIAKNVHGQALNKLVTELVGG